jgi:hypothetical protein
MIATWRSLESRSGTPTISHRAKSLLVHFSILAIHGSIEKLDAPRHDPKRSPRGNAPLRESD